MSAVLFDKGALSGVDLRAVPLNSNYQYLHVELDGKPPALLVLGYLDPHPQGEIEVWYSSAGEVLKLQDGRIVGATGLPVDWRRVSYAQSPPSWTSFKSAKVDFVRVRDESPGYRLGLSEQVSLAQVENAPDVARGHHFSAKTTWFRETYSGTEGTVLPDSWFAWAPYQAQNAVVYSRQCLSAQVCLTLQRWPPEKDPL
jgi:hypothetical protein